jgi:hypothetical protein
MESRKHKTLLWMVVAMLLGALALAATLARARWIVRHRITIGAVEEARLLPWNITIPARVDTGATTSSLDAREIKELPGGKEIEFRLADRCGGHVVRRRLRGWRTVISSDGKSERRPLVDMEFWLGERRLRTRVTLTDRSAMKFPMLLGRNTLGGRYVVDVTHTNLLSRCAPEPTQLEAP